MSWGQHIVIDIPAQKIALALGAEVIVTDYPLAPENNLGETLDSLINVYQIIQEMEKPGKLVLMGDSAGASLCLALVRQLMNKNPASLAQNLLCVLFSPWVDPAQPERLEAAAESGDLLNLAIINKWAQAIFKTPESEPLVRFSACDWVGFPPTYIQAAGAEVFLPQIRQLVTHMERDGVRIQFDVFEEQFHVFQTLAPMVQEVDQALQGVARFVTATGQEQSNA